MNPQFIHRTGTVLGFYWIQNVFGVAVGDYIGKFFMPQLKKVEFLQFFPVNKEKFL